MRIFGLDLSLNLDKCNLSEFVFVFDCFDGL